MYTHMYQNNDTNKPLDLVDVRLTIHALCES